MIESISRAISMQPLRLILAGAVLATLSVLPPGRSPAAAASTPAPVEGLWLTDDRRGIVRISACGAQLCGSVVQVLDKRPGVPTTDVNNPDPRLRTRPIVGLRTLWGFTRDGDRWSGGHAYDPETGKSYPSTLALKRDGTLKVTGCVLIVCESRRWTRVR